MSLDIKELITTRLGENYELHDRHVNKTLVKVLRTIGFDKVYARAEGSYLYDMDGNAYLDFLSGYGVFNIGRNHPKIQQVIKDVMEMDLPNMVQMDCALLSGLLAEAITKRTGPNLDAVFFCNSGTEAVEGALKFARCASGKPGVVAVEGSYHGLSMGALSITHSGNFREGFGPFLNDVQFVKHNDINDLEAKLKTGTIGTFIIELVQGKGVKIVSDAYILQARELCRKYKTLFISDEVQTGMGRTGKLFAYQHWDLDPDIITIAKALSGGYVPAAGFVTRRDIYQKVYSRLDRCVAHSTTFGRNNLAMACGLATIDIIEEEKLAENAALRGAQLLERLQELQKRHDMIKEVRGKGLMLAIEFQEPKSLKLKLAWKGIHAVDKGLFAQMIVTPLLQKHRILAQVAGHNMDVVKILPPLIIGEKEIDLFVHALDDTIQSLTSFPGPVWDFGANLVKAALSNGYVSASR
ncbi:MAG: aspartate aminotransferase family protein [Blastochloris sp.]|nr:aspartate aminotransferase family protein [Blastochloris sp.]